MDPFQKLPGFRRGTPGLELRIARRLPALLLGGTALPLLLLLLALFLAPSLALSAAAERELGLWMYGLLGLILLHWSLWLTLALGCLIVWVMKGPAYVADAYPLPGAERLGPLD